MLKKITLICFTVMVAIVVLFAPSNVEAIVLEGFKIEIDPGDFPDMLKATKALRESGLEPVPHIPARFTANAAQAAGERPQGQAEPAVAELRASPEPAPQEPPGSPRRSAATSPADAQAASRPGPRGPCSRPRRACASCCGASA